MADLLVIVPSRGRPGSIRHVLDAWLRTRAFADAELMLAIDADDPVIDGYREIGADWANSGVSLFEIPEWQSMVGKLNDAARHVAADHRALAFMGDDHLPRTVGWARAYLDALRELGTGIVYGDDLLQGERLPTQWAMTSDIVRALGRMVPADVEHLYCDNAILALGYEAGCIRHLPDVVIEHMHPVARKASMDAGYLRVNSPERYARDRAAFERWIRDGLAGDAARVRELGAVVANGG